MEVLYKERQKYKRWWIWLIVICIDALFVFLVFNRLLMNEITNYYGLLIMFALTLFVAALFVVFRLDTIVKEDGLYIRYFPFHFKYRYFSWNQLIKCNVIPFSPIANFNGWGIGFRLIDKANKYRLSNERGLQIEFSDNKNLLIGSKTPEKLAAILMKYKGKS